MCENPMLLHISCAASDDKPQNGRNMKSKILALLGFLLLTLPAAVQAQFNYTNDSGTITITSYTGPGSPGNPGSGVSVSVPSTIGALPVKRIGDDSFGFCQGVSSVTIPNSVTNIGSGVFGFCDGLTSITIPNSVTSIGASAFSFCTRLPSVTVPASVTSIGSNTFNWCMSLTGVYFQGNAPSGGSDSSVFSGADNATAYYLCGTTGWGPTWGGRPTVQLGCTGTTLATPVTSSPACGSSVSTVTPTLSWGDVANESGYVVRIFSGGSCSGTPVHTSSQLAANTTSYSVPSSAGLQNGQTYSWQVQPKGNCTTYCDGNPSSCCSFSVPCITLSTPTPAAPACGSTVTTILPTLNWTDVANASGFVVRIFSGGSCLGTPIHISSQLEAHTTSYQVPSLQNGQSYSWQVQAKGNGTIYCDSGWSGCCSFSVSAPCTTLPTPTSTAPACGSTVDTTTPTLGWGDVGYESGYVVRVFSGGSCSGAPVHTSSQLAANTTSYSVPSSVLQVGQTYSWQVQAKGDGTTYCDSGGSGCCSFVVVPTQAQDYTYTTNNGSVTITGYKGSGGAVTIPASINGLSVTSIGTRAFQYCTGLTTITIPNSVTSIGEDAFYSCTALTHITIPNSVTSIGTSAFHDCTSLTSFTIPNSFTTIGDYWFLFCTSLTNVAIPNSVTNLGHYAFSQCSRLTTVTIPNSVTTIGDAAFGGCSGLTTLTIPIGVTSIGASAFSSCSSLTNITIPNSVTSIGGSAFSYCPSLIAIYFQGNAPSGGSDCSIFNGANNVTNYYLAGTTGWGPTFGCRPTGLWNLPRTGSLQVTIAPAAAVNSGAQWQVDGGTWQTSGATVTGLSVGSHTLAFKSVVGWNTPSSQNVTINNNSTTTTSGTYTVQTAVPGAITLVSPSGSLAAGSSQRYTWRADTNASWYELCVTRNGSVFCDKWFTLSNSVVDSATGNFAVDVGGHVGGSYQWWVRGWSPAGLGPWTNACSFSLGIPGAVVLLSPANNASLSNRQPQLTWSQSLPAATWFRLYVTRNQNQYLDQWIEGATNWMPTADLPASSYAWCVQTYSSAGLGPWSTNSAFTIPAAIPTNLVLVSPTGSANAGSVQRYTWRADAAAVWYELYVVQNGKMLCDQWFALSNSLAQSGGGNFMVQVGGHTGGSYQWYVRGWGPDGQGPWSGPGSFTMAPPPPPGAVMLLTPTNNASVLGRQPEFKWTLPNPAADWYDVYVVRNGSKYLEQWVEGATNWVAMSGLPGGTYTWWVHPWNGAGYGPWSTNFSFTIPTAVPGVITLVSPSGSVAAGSTQRYTWRADAAAIWYELYVVRNGSAFVDQWYTLTNSVVDRATGSFAVDVGGHGTGTYQWWVRGWGPDGLGPWSSNLTFQVP